MSNVEHRCTQNNQILIVSIHWHVSSSWETHISGQFFPYSNMSLLTCLTLTQNRNFRWKKHFRYWPEIPETPAPTVLYLVHDQHGKIEESAKLEALINNSENQDWFHKFTCTICGKLICLYHVYFIQHLYLIIMIMPNG